MVLVSWSVRRHCATPSTKAPETSSAASAVEAEKQHEFAAEREIESWRRFWRVTAPPVVHRSELCGEELTPYLEHLYPVEWNRKAIHSTG